LVEALNSAGGKIFPGGTRDSSCNVVFGIFL
jgi:hypothetical protein